MIALSACQGAEYLADKTFVSEDAPRDQRLRPNVNDGDCEVIEDVTLFGAVCTHLCGNPAL